MYDSVQWMDILGIFSMKKAPQPPYSDEVIRKHILKIKNTMQNNADMMLKYEKAFVKTGLIQNGIRKEVEHLKPSQKEAFKIYDGLKKSQSNLQSQLEQFEAYLSIRSGQTQPSGKGPYFYGK